jgi:Domain of unknown function (DUF4249)
MEMIFIKSRFKWLLVFLLLTACVERIYFDVPLAQFQTVVEGFISDSPGPYTVKITNGLNLDGDFSNPAPVQNAKIKLYDDQGGVEAFTEISPGVYMTNGLIHGQVGHSYHIILETPDGNMFKSEPDMINHVGEIEDVRFEFEARTVVEDFGEINADVFNIFVDAEAGGTDSDEKFVRWRFTGTYRIISNPELHMVYNPPYTPYKDPRPCSGYILVSGPGGGLLERRGDCTCCTCWVNHFENSPQLSDLQLVDDGQFRNVKVGEVPISNNTFHDKYMVEVEQMSLSKRAFDFFKLIRSQKEGASSLFQPPSGEIKGNLIPVNNSENVIGLFWATSVKTKVKFIQRSDIPYPVTPIEFIAEDCRLRWANSSNIEPKNWE